MEFYSEPARNIPIRRFDVVVAGGGTAGVIAAIAAARAGAKTALIEQKGYTGGTVVEGGTALHSFYNLYSFFDVPKKQLVGGIPWELVSRLQAIGGATEHAQMELGNGYDAVNTAVDVEMYKTLSLNMLKEAGVHIFLNTMVVGAAREGGEVVGAICESHSGRELFAAKAFIDAGAYGDLSAHAGAEFSEPNDHQVANSIGVAGVSVEKYYEHFAAMDSMDQIARAPRDGSPDRRFVRVQPLYDKMPEAFKLKAKEIGLSSVITTTHDDYFMFLKLNYKSEVSPVDRDAGTTAEIELRNRQKEAVELLRKYIPGCEKAFIARSSPSVNIRRGRCIACDYDMTIDDVLKARHFEDDVLIYGFHDSAPRLQIENGGDYGLPFRALRVKGLDNLMAVGMLISSDFAVHMSTRNTVCCMAQGQAAGIAAALCAQRGETTRELPYPVFKEALLRQGVILS